MVGRTRGRWERGLLRWGALMALAVVVLLLLHSESMPIHHDDHGCATCAVVAVAGALGALLTTISHDQAPTPRVLVVLVPSPTPSLSAIISGRHPPSRGTVLRL